MKKNNIVKPKILLISLNPCYPLYHGGAIAQYFFIDGLKNDVDFVFCTQINSEQELENIKSLQEKQHNLKIYFTNNIPIQPPPKRVLWFFLSKLKRKIKCLLGKKEKTLLRRINDDDFQLKWFINIDKDYNEEFVKLINKVIIDENIKIVQFEFNETLLLALAVPKEVKKIFIYHELRFKRLQLAYDKSKLLSEYKKFIINKVELHEKSCLQKMDSVIVFNDDDADVLKNDCKNIVVSPFSIPDELIYKKEVSAFFSRFLFVGGENHLPNSLGLSWFLDEIFVPNINKINYPIHIVGNWSDGFKNKYKEHVQIVFCGIVESMEPYFKNSIFVNPILTGSGIRTKVLHAYANKVPVVSTRFGAEGCFNEMENAHLLLFDSAQEFMTELQKIYDAYLKQIAEKGYLFYNEKFNKENLLKKRLIEYEQ